MVSNCHSSHNHILKSYLLWALPKCGGVRQHPKQKTRMIHAAAAWLSILFMGKLIVTYDCKSCHWSLDLLRYNISFPNLFPGVYSNVQLEECNTVYCLSEPVQYQCIVTGSVLQWRIRDETMMSLGTQSYISISDPGTFYPITGAAVFSTDLSSTSPSIISNISFTVQSSINGYTIQCEDGNGNENCTISIQGTL